MIDMEEYKRKIMNSNTEKKVKKNIRNAILITGLYYFFGVISAVLFIVGIVELINKSTNGAIFYGLGILVLISDIIMLLSYDTFDPLRTYSINDKLFIYLTIFNENSRKDRIKGRSTFKKQYLFYTVKKMNIQLYKIKYNIENTFIFRDENYKYYTKYLDKFILLFNGKDYENEYFIRADEIQDCIEKIISLYEFNIFNEIINEYCNSNSNYKEVKVKKIENLIKDIDFILKEDDKHNHDFKSNSNFKSKFSIKLLFLIILDIMPLIFLALKKDSIISFIFTVYFPIMSVNIWTWTNKSKKME
ncbi:hypothetical protein [Clostridium estertheticum]|uniref:hypothetical protein n=1 Tax=Clostridium estertheticum TaxID=238834 RepID=UPI001CF1F54D|nr:hypothetical protein [Clostridium estertheticum]MCB2360291.1 hypothetical protein [Clostridium estertheticum]